MVIVWSMAVVGIVFTFGLAAFRSAEHKKLHALRLELESQQ